MKLVEKFEVHDYLNPSIWTSENKLHDDVKLKLLEIIEQFESTCDIPLNMVDAHIVGSNASYNYTCYSDLDVHIISNFDLLDAPKEIVQLAFNAVKAKFNSDYDISIHGIDVELYVEDIRSGAVSNGVYSLYQDSWIKFPKKLTDVLQPDIGSDLELWRSKFVTAIESEDSEKITQVINDIYLVRKNSLDVDGEYGIGNQLFKEIRNCGLLDAAKDAYKVARSKELTLERLQLHEDSRTTLLAKSKRTDKGFQRFKKRVKSRVANSVKQYNSIDMNKLFKEDILTVDVQVKGETDVYTVKISFGGFLELLHDQLKKQEFNLKAVTRALITGFNRDDVYIHCSCPDSRYRFAYWQTRKKTNSGDPENRPANITNPNDTLGEGCKHVLLVLSNTSWLLKVASTIFNYVNYMEKHYERLYKKILYPAIFQKAYDEPEQLEIDGVHSDDLETDTDTLDKANVHARTKNQFKKGNEYRFQAGPDKRQITFDDLDDSPDGLIDV